MIAGLDSSFDRPTPAQAAAAYAAGVRVWGGYIGTRAGLGLATLWSQADFDVVRNAGMSAIGFCSGWDDPVGVRDLAAAWGVLLCVDVESGIRNDGPWVQGWLDASGAGLYGLSSVHGGRSAAFHIVAWYGANPPTCSDPGAAWPSWLARPAGPCGWQFCGTHDEFGLSVDRGWYDDWFGWQWLPVPDPPPPPSPPTIPPEDAMVVVEHIDRRLHAFMLGLDNQVWHNEQQAVGLSAAWSGWNPLSVVGNKALEIKAIVQADGRLHAFMIGLDNQLWHNEQKTATPNAAWTGWSELSKPGDKARATLPAGAV